MRGARSGVRLVPTADAITSWKRFAFAAGVVLVSATAASAQESRWAIVARVIDGDTVQLVGGRRVRLIGVDTPEIDDSRRPVEQFALEAAEFVRRMVERKRVRLEFDWERTDKYGRTLAYLYLEDGTFVNAEIVRQGFGFAYTRFPFKYLDEFRALEREAREAGRGFWGAASSEAKPRPAIATDPRSCPPTAPIKGNLTTRSGECIFHVPGAEYYSRTKPERCFATEDEAVAAGCRKSQR